MNKAMHQQFVIPEHLPFLEIRTTNDSNLPYAEHFHTNFSFGLILAGHTSFSLGKEKYLAQPGDIVLIDPEQAHSCNPVENMPRSYHMAYVTPVWFYGLGVALFGNYGLRVGNPLIRDAEIFMEARNLFDAVCSNPAAVENNLMMLFIKMHNRHQCFWPISLSAPRHNIRALAERSVAGEIMEGGYSISELARNAGIRRESFSRSFRRATGLPPSCYLHCLRLEYGRRLLQEGRSVAEASVASGYADQSHFHRMFVKYCSVTPGCYRKNQSHPYKK